MAPFLIALALLIECAPEPDAEPITNIPLGVTGRPLPDLGGVALVTVQPGSAADQLGLRPGDVLAASVDEPEIKGRNPVAHLLDGELFRRLYVPRGRVLYLFVRREGRTYCIRVDGLSRRGTNSESEVSRERQAARCAVAKVITWAARPPGSSPGLST